ncbi:MAG: glycosyl hydrolase, partial [Bacteroidota bacterium]
MGQTVERITEYLDYFPDEAMPGGWSAYWGVPEFKGITQAHKNNTGSTQHHQMLVDQFPNTVIQSAMWMVGKWEVAKKAGKGDYDKVIKQYAEWAKSTNRPIYLRIGYEFDGPHNELEPEQYVKAYRRIVKLLRKKGANNIAFVWHSYASRPYNSYKLSAWYPGDEYVDWVGISVFGHAYGGADFGPYCDDVLNFAKAHKKPVMIAEANPIQGVDQEGTTAWDQWFANFFSFIYRKNIKAVSFINEDWPRLYIPDISHWKDGRLYNNDKVAKAWFRETNKARYLKQSPELFTELGYSKE